MLTGGNARTSARRSSWQCASTTSTRVSTDTVGISSRSNVHSRTVGSCSEVGTFSSMIAKLNGADTRLASKMKGELQSASETWAPVPSGFVQVAATHLSGGCHKRLRT